MFSLVIVLISILLVGALAAATVYYGGSSSLDAGTRASATRLLNESSQITGAAVLYRATRGESAQSIDQLVSESFLSAAPSGGWETDNDRALVVGLSEAQCTAINATLGIAGVPSCTDPAYAEAESCCIGP